MVENQSFVRPSAMISYHVEMSLEVGGKLVFRSKCSLNRLDTPQGTLWPLTRAFEVVN